MAQLDTSGFVRLPSHHGGTAKWAWGGLDDFTQGYVEAMAMDPAHGLARTVAFSSIAPETLKRIIEDCRWFQKPPTDWVVFNRTTGGDFWRDRQCRQLTRLATERFPPLTVSLGGDGLIYFVEGA